LWDFYRSIIIMEITKHLPIYIKISQISLGIVAFTFVMYAGQEIILPLIFSIIIAILLNPLVNYLQHKGCNRVIAISIAVFLTFLVTVSLLYFIISQFSMFSDALPQLKGKFNSLVDDIVKWISQTFNVSTKNVKDWIARQQSESLNSGTMVIGQTISTISGVLVIVFLLPVYIFLFLFYKPLLLQFIAQLFPQNKHTTVAEVLAETRTLIQSYLIGLLVEAAIVATLNAASLLVIGIDYAILLGIIGALLNVIPYIGGIIAVAIPMILALVTKEPVYAIYVLIAHLTVQFIDNNFIVPKIVASRVKINALVSIIVVFIGDAIWGIPGMFLSLPLTAIVKVIFDRIEPLRPFGFLIGDTMPSVNRTIFKFKKKTTKK
jgi:predicted PurR-regulated permease PerM